MNFLKETQDHVANVSAQDVKQNITPRFSMVTHSVTFLTACTIFEFCMGRSTFCETYPSVEINLENQLMVDLGGKKWTFFGARAKTINSRKNNFGLAKKCITSNKHSRRKKIERSTARYMAKYDRTRVVCHK